jgi:hypothetical protein
MPVNPIAVLRTNSFSFEIDRYDGKPAHQPFDLCMPIAAWEEAPVVIGLETAVEMNLVQVGRAGFADPVVSPPPGAFRK